MSSMSFFVALGGVPLKGRTRLASRIAAWWEALGQNQRASIPSLVALSFLAGVGGAAQGKLAAGTLVLGGCIGIVLALWPTRQWWRAIAGLCLLACGCGAVAAPHLSTCPF